MIEQFTSRRPDLIGIEVKSKENFNALITRMDSHKLNYTLVNQNEWLEVRS